MFARNSVIDLYLYFSHFNEYEMKSIKRSHSSEHKAHKCRPVQHDEEQRRHNIGLQRNLDCVRTIGYCRYMS